MLNVYLKRVSFITGPRLKNTSHSGLEVIKKYLTGAQQFQGGEGFLLFGNGTHEPFLTEDYKGSYAKLTVEEKTRVNKMITKLNSHPVVKMLMKDSVREEKFITDIEGVPVAVILDSKQIEHSRGFDLKTTTARNLADFIKKAISFGYIRQGKTYKIAAKLKHFYFVGIQKEEPYNVYVLNISDYKDEEWYASEELKFLLYFYKHYGKIEDGETSSLKKEEIKNVKLTTMGKLSGKEVMTSIKEAVAEAKALKKESAKAVTLAEKAKAKALKLIEKFPSNEKELYEEKLNSFTASLN
jgi:hypothetical protein